MKRRILYGGIGAVIFLLIGAFIGFLLGTYIGGNYYPEFVFLTWKGYEAVGWIGIILGGIIGGLLGYGLGIRMTNRWGI